MSQVRNFLMLTKLNSKCSICTIFKSPTERVEEIKLHFNAGLYMYICICNSGYRNEYHDPCVTNISFLNYAIYIEISSLVHCQSGCFRVSVRWTWLFMFFEQQLTSEASGTISNKQCNVLHVVLFGICNHYVVVMMLMGSDLLGLNIVFLSIGNRRLDEWCGPNQFIILSYPFNL